MKTETPREWVIAKSLVREWLIEKDIALTGVHGEASNSTVNRFKLDLQRRIVDALNAERERCARIADERAAFNRRLATGSKISDTIDSRVADLKFTRADEAEVIAKEIREGKQSEDYATVRANRAVDAIRGSRD